MKELPKYERPRERLLELGPQNLSSAELIAILLSSGTKKHNVLSVSKAILKKYPSEKLSEIGLNELKKIDGLGEVKAGKIIAAVELGRRSYSNGTRKQIKSLTDILVYVHDIRNERREHLVAIYLNARNEVISKQTIAVGTLNQNIIEPRDVFAEALKTPCASIVLVHNHPSGESEPSDQDIVFTKKLSEVGKMLGIEILDHIIVSETSECSLKRRELM